MKVYIRRRFIAFFITLLLSVSGLTFSQVMGEDDQRVSGVINSYMIFDNGKIGSLRDRGENLNIFTPDGMFMLEYDYGITKSNYFTNSFGRIFTLDANGYIYEKQNYLMNSSIEYFGGMFFVTKKGQLHVVKSDGMIIYYNYIEGDDSRDPVLVGGNYLMSKYGKLYVITSDGYFTKIEKEEAKFMAYTIKHKGFNFFINRDGEVYTTGEEKQLGENETEYLKGVMYKIKDLEIKDPEVVGGNYFFDNNMNLYTVSMSGHLSGGGVSDKNFIVKGHENELPEVIGSDYFVYKNQDVYQINKLGELKGPLKINYRVLRTNNYLVE